MIAAAVLTHETMGTVKIMFASLGAYGHLSGAAVRAWFVAQSEVLPLVDLIVHHLGTGTVLGELEAGLPQLLLPQ